MSQIERSERKKQGATKRKSNGTTCFGSFFSLQALTGFGTAQAGSSGRLERTPTTAKV